MSARNQDAWQRLRKDKRSAFVVLLIIAAGIAAILAFIGVLLGPSRAGDRANPLYWALLLPFAWWAAALANYTAWAVKILRSAAAIAALSVLLSLGIAANRGLNLTPWLLATLVAIPCAAIGAILFPKTLLSRTRG